MYEEYYGFTEKPFSLTPDPKYLYKSETHANAFDLLQYAIQRREGFVVITGDIGTGKTTLCRAILEQLDSRTFTALVLNPFITEEDLLRIVLQDFGVVSREEVKRGRLLGVTKQELIDTLNEFLLSLQPIGARALLIIDEAQNLPNRLLEQIRILSNLETEKEKLLQIVLVGQTNLQGVLRSPNMRQLDQRVSIRYELRPLTRDECAAYVAHRLSIAGGGASVTFTSRALDLVHRFTGGTPRLINLLCDRSLLGGFSERTNRITPSLVKRAASSLDLRLAPVAWAAWLRRRAAFLVASAALAVAPALSVLVLMQVGAIPPWEEPAPVAAAPAAQPASAPVRTTAVNAAPAAARRASFSIFVGSFESEEDAAARARELQQLGFNAYRATVEREDGSRSLQLLVGTYDNVERARDDERRLRQVAAFSSARVVLN
ncbi:MAG: AAA family ATPase [Acidobacteria bacterium]|nr:AAA family ATPase [Acidobacteriota bacterium]